jgi:hypothetical protein
MNMNMIVNLRINVNMPLTWTRTPQGRGYGTDKKTVSDMITDKDLTTDTGTDMNMGK